MENSPMARRRSRVPLRFDSVFCHKFFFSGKNKFDQCIVRITCYNLFSLETKFVIECHKFSHRCILFAY